MNGHNALCSCDACEAHEAAEQQKHWVDVDQVTRQIREDEEDGGPDISGHKEIGG